MHVITSGRYLNILPFGSILIWAQPQIKYIQAHTHKIEKLIEPFGDLETILELKTLYGEVIPDILLGNYDNVTDAMPEDAKEITMVMIKQRRKNMFNRLADKYNG